MAGVSVPPPPLVMIAVSGAGSGPFEKALNGTLSRDIAKIVAALR